MKEMEQIRRCGVVPVVVLDDAGLAVQTAEAMLAGGIDVMEITFRTAAAAEAIRLVAEAVPGMLVGAGTVVTAEQCREALRCGAKFIVSPGYDEDVVSLCAAEGVPVLPGCATPTEIMAAMRHGLSVVKFFPAQVYGGLPAMKALSGPFPALQFVPTGGVGAENLREYLEAPFVFAVGGSWLCPRKAIAAGEFSKITALCRAANQIREEVQ